MWVVLMVKKKKPKTKKGLKGIEKEAGKLDLKQFEELGLGMPVDMQKKLKTIKAKLDKFQDKVLKKFDKYVIGMALIPPPPKSKYPGMPPLGTKLPPLPSSPTIKAQLPQAKKVDKKDLIDVLILVDDSDSTKMSKLELKARLSLIIQNMAKEIDKNIVAQTIVLSEVWQSCYDAKYDILKTIALSAPLYDSGMLAAIKIAEIHKTMVLKKFEKYIVSYVLAGSLTQGRATLKSDVDVFIVIDDTDVKKMTRAELKDKLRAIIIGMGIEAGDLTGIKNKLNIQVYILTDFWDNLKEANPIIFTLLRDGVPFYDRGMFMPWKQLLKMGKIKPSQEAIDLFMNTGDQMLERVHLKIKTLGMEDIYYAILTPSQAALMLYGIPPPAPFETPKLMREIFVKKEKILEEEYIKILEKNIKTRKEVEHGAKKKLTGKDVDELLNDSEKYLKRIKKLFKQIQKKKEQEDMLKVYDTTVTLIRDILRLEGVEKVDDLEIVKLFEDEMINQGKIPEKYLRILNAIMKAKKKFDESKLTQTEVEKVKKDSREFMKFMVEYVQRKRGREIERTRIRVKHGNRFGEVILLGDIAFIIHDIDHEEKELSKAKINKDGSLGTTQKATLEELEKALVKVDIPPKVFIKEPIFENLKDIFGKDVEVLINN